MSDPSKPELVLAADTLFAEFLSVAPEFGVRQGFEWDLARVETEYEGDHAAYLKDAFSTFLENHLEEPNVDHPTYEDLVITILQVFTALSEAAAFPDTDIWSESAGEDEEGGPAYHAFRHLKDAMERLVACKILQYRGKRYRYPWEIVTNQGDEK